MNKYVGAHIHPFKPVDLTTSSTPKKRKSEQKGPKEKKAKSSGGGLQAPYQLSPELSRVVGKQILPRPQVTKKLWEYIREHELQVSLVFVLPCLHFSLVVSYRRKLICFRLVQNPDDRREILCDQWLKLVMGGEEKVTYVHCCHVSFVPIAIPHETAIQNVFDEQVYQRSFAGETRSKLLCAFRSRAR